MSKAMERTTGAVEEHKNEGDPSPLSSSQAGEEASGVGGKKNARLMVAEMIEQAVADAVERRFQSAKDKRWSELEKQYGSLSELAGKLESGGKLGASAEQATEVKDDVVLAVPDGDAPDNLTQDLAERVQTLAKLPGLKKNEDARAILLRHAKPEGIENYAALLEDLLKLGGGLPADSGGQPTPASAVIPGGGDAPADLRQAYERRKRTLRPGDINALTALKRDFRQRGLDVF